MPIYYLTGNHDSAAAIQSVLMKRETVEPFLYYEFEAKGVQVLCLDSNGPHIPENPSGFVTEEQLDWLDARCAADDERPLVVAVHHNILPVQVTFYIYNGQEDRDGITIINESFFRNSAVQQYPINIL